MPPTLNLWGLRCGLSFSQISKCFFYEAGCPGISGIDVQNWDIMLVYFPLICMQCPFPSLFIISDWKSILPDIRLAAAAWLLGPFAYRPFVQSFILWQCLSLWLSCISVCNRSIDSVYASTPLDCVFLFGKWICSCSEILIINDCFYLVFWFWFACVSLGWFYYAIISFLCFIEFSYSPCLGVLLVASWLVMD